MKRLVGMCFVIGCTSSHSTPTPEPAAAVQPQTCAATLTLVGSTSVQPTDVGPFTLDTNGVNLCARLDATQLTRTAMMAGTNQVPGDTSGLVATLQHVDYSTILEGWDVQVSNGTFLDVEWSPPAGQTTDVIVWVRAASAPVTTSFSLDLFDPLE
jgi:hypothetical protein